MDKQNEKRAENYSQLEIETLIRHVEKYKHIVESKISYAVSWKEKKETWDKIAVEFNSELGCSRTATKLKTKWENMKKTTKKKFAQEKCGLYKTGGGPYVSPGVITKTDNDIKDVIGVGVVGLDSEFDHDETLSLDYKEPLSSTPVSQRGPQQMKIIAIRKLDGTLLKKPISSVSFLSKKDVPFTPEEKNYMNEETTSWSSWNPAKLKQAISVELLPSVSQGNSNIEKGVRQKNETVSITKETHIKKKSRLTQDCRVKINTLSEVKIELITIQKECVIQEMELNKKESELKILQMEEDQAMKREKHELEIQILKNQISK